MKRLLTYGLLLLTILASHFVVSACQEDVPETTEVIMTFTTRALIKQDDANAEINAEQLRTLHVIMRKSDGTIYHASRQDIQENQVTVTFEDVPVSTGEEFEFFAIANQEGIMWNGTTYNVSNPTTEMLSNFPDLTIGNGGVYALTNHLIPQTKYWKEKIYPSETTKIGKQLDFTVGKISVQFVNETNNNQSLNNIKVTGVKPNGYGYLFAPIEGGNRVEDYCPQDVNTEIGFESVNNLQAKSSSSIQHYYTYPIDAANITNPQFEAQWNGTTHTLNLSELKELKRGQHLKIVVTLSGVGIQVAYNIVDWVENTTTIGGLNSTLGDNYFIADWDNDDVVIGGEDEPEVPEGPVTVEGLTISANPAIIDLASATTTTLTINKPANITAITITPSGNSAFTRLSIPSSGSITDDFKITGLSNNAGTVTVTLTANSNAATGPYTLTASGTGGDDYISNVATTTITLSKTPSGGGGGIIWEKTGLHISVSNQNYKDTPCEIGDETTKLSDIIKVGRIFGIEFTCTGNSGYYYSLVLVQGNNGYYDNITGSQVNFKVDDNYHEFQLDQNDVNLITTENNKLYFLGNGIIITRIYIKESL